MHFFPILPLQTLALEKSRILWGQAPSHAILISSFSEPPVAVGGSKLQASHHILYVTQLYWAREGLPGADCDNCGLREGNAIPSDILMCGQQPRCTGTTRYQYPHFTLNYEGRRRHRVPQGLPACGPWAKQRATVHNRLEANPKGTFRAAIKALQLSRRLPIRSMLLFQAQDSQPDFLKS